MVNGTFSPFNTVEYRYFYDVQNSNRYTTAQSIPYTGSTADHFTYATFDALGRPLSVTAPDGTGATYDYNGLTTIVMDANGHTHTTVTDILGRTTSVTPPTGPGVAYTYDPLGRLLTATRGGVTTTKASSGAG